MKNKEFYKKELEEIMVKGKSFGIHKTTGNLIGCARTSCENCAFRETNKMCMEYRQEWLEQEHVEEDKWKDFRHLKKGDVIEIKLEDGWYFRSFNSIHNNTLQYSTRAEESYIYADFLFTISDPSRVRLPEFKDSKEKEYYEKWKKAEASCKRLSDNYKDLIERYNERGNKIHRYRMDLAMSRINTEHEKQTLTKLKDVNDILIGKLKDQLSDAKVQIETLNKDFEAQRKLIAEQKDKNEKLNAILDIKDDRIERLRDKLSNARVQTETLNKDFEAQRKLNENQQVMIRELRERFKNRCDQCHRNDILKYENKELKGKLSEIENVLAKKNDKSHDDIIDSISYSLKSKEDKNEKINNGCSVDFSCFVKRGKSDLW